MMNLHFTCLLVLLLVCWLNMFYCSNYDGNVPNDMHASQLNSLLSINAENNMERDDEKNNYDKRVERYAFGLGRRGYTYTNGNGMKRLPVYNFGLGKRDPYSFDLSKRSDLNGIDNELLVNQELNKNFNTAALLDEKRNQPYSFGLGKREPSEEAGRRAYPMRYGFGLGR